MAKEEKVKKEKKDKQIPLHELNKLAYKGYVKRQKALSKK